MERFHQGALHSLGFVATATLPLALLLRRRLGISRAWLLLAAAGLTHLLLDLMVVDLKPPVGFPFFWPLSAERFHAPFTLFPGIDRTSLLEPEEPARAARRAGLVRSPACLLLLRWLPLRARGGRGRAMKVLLVAPQPFYRERGTPIAVRLLAETLCAPRPRGRPARLPRGRGDLLPRPAPAAGPAAAAGARRPDRLFREEAGLRRRADGLVPAPRPPRALRCRARGRGGDLPRRVAAPAPSRGGRLRHGLGHGRPARRHASAARPVPAAARRDRAAHARRLRPGARRLPEPRGPGASALPDGSRCASSRTSR